MRERKRIEERESVCARESENIPNETIIPQLSLLTENVAAKENTRHQT